MQQKDRMVNIPAADAAPETNLFIKIMHEDEACLDTRPYVFMLPGGPGSNHSFYQDYACLTDVANVVFYDPRGCGLSDKGDPATYTMDNYIKDLEIIRQHLQVDKMFLLGKSYGAMCALYYTLEYPQNVDRLILAAGSPSGKMLETAKKNIAVRGNDEQRRVCELLFSGKVRDDTEMAYYFGVMSTMYSYRVRNNLPVDRPQPEYPFASAALNLGFSDFLRKFDFTGRLHEVTCPTLILVGDQDWVTDPVYSKQMAKGIKNSKLIIYENSDHSMESDVPERFFADIRKFVGE